MSIGYKNQKIGKIAERMFENQLKMMGVLFFRIEDGERFNQFSFKRRPQPFDYFIVNKGQILSLIHI